MKKTNYFCTLLFVAIQLNAWAQLVTLDSIIDPTSGSKQRFTYDVNGNVIENWYRDWYDDTKIVRTFDEKKRILTEETTNTDLLNPAYNNSTREIFEYHDKMTTKQSFDWNRVEEKWVLDRTVQDYYNDKQLKDSSLISPIRKSDVEFEPNTRVIYRYNEDNILIQSDYTYYSESTNTWLNYQQDNFVIDEQGNVTRSSLSLWDEILEMWVESPISVEIIHFEYDEDGKITSSVSVFDGSRQDSTVFSYDNNGNTISEVVYNWKEKLNEWVLAFKVQYEFSNDLRLDEMVFGDFDISELNFIYRPTSIFLEEVNEGESEVFLYYSDIVGLNAKSQFQSSIYPNPAQNFINVSTDASSISVYDILGNRLHYSELFSEVFDVSFLENGSYVIEVETENGVVSERLNIYR